MCVCETVEILRHIGMHQLNSYYSLPATNIVPVEYSRFQAVGLETGMNQTISKTIEIVIELKRVSEEVTE